MNACLSVYYKLLMNISTNISTNIRYNSSSNDKSINEPNNCSFSITVYDYIWLFLFIEITLDGAIIFCPVVIIY